MLLEFYSAQQEAAAAIFRKVQFQRRAYVNHSFYLQTNEDIILPYKSGYILCRQLGP